MQYLRGLRS